MIVEGEHGDQDKGEEREGPDHVVEHADVGDDAETELANRITLLPLLAQVLLPLLLGGFLFLFAVDHVGVFGLAWLAEQLLVVLSHG